MDEHITWATALRMLANLLTVTTGFAWLKFADSRDGILSAPNLHHRVYLRVLIGLSTAAFLVGLLSLAVASHAGAPLVQHAQRHSTFSAQGARYGLGARVTGPAPAAPAAGNTPRTTAR